MFEGVQVLLAAELVILIPTCMCTLTCLINGQGPINGQGRKIQKETGFIFFVK